MVETGTVSLETAAKVIGVSRNTAYELARSGRFPCRILRIGRLYKVPKADLNALLGQEREPQPVS